MWTLQIKWVYLFNRWVLPGEVKKNVLDPQETRDGAGNKEPSRAGPRRAEANRGEPSRAGPGRARPSRDEASRAEMA